MYDIHQVCQMLSTTSRTLRYYEEQGLITCERDTFSQRRRFTAEQVACVRNVLALRTLGLSLNTIAALQANDTTLKEAIMLRRAEIEACIKTKLQDLSRLNAAVSQLDANIISIPLCSQVASENRVSDIVQQCCNAILKKDTTFLYSYFTEKLTNYLPETVFCDIWQEITLPLGAFCTFKKRWHDETLPNTVYQHLHFEKLDLCIKFVFCGDKIDGIWMEYCEQEE